MLHIRTILVPTDFSAEAEQALHVAQSLARDHHASLILVHAPFPMPYVTTEVNLPAVDFAGMSAEAQRQLDSLVRSAPDLPAETRVSFAAPGPAIVTAAKDDQVDLIVMATHGRSGIGRMLLGSVAEYVLRHAPCPVLTIKPHTAECLSHLETTELAAPVSMS